jgi:integrase
MRPRKNDRHLPACVYLKHGAYYLVRKGKWVPLGSDLKLALAKYAKEIERPGDGMPGLLHRWLDDVVVADKTRAVYTTVVKQLTETFAEYQPHQVTARDITAVLHHHRKKPAMANHMRTVLINALEFAYLENLVERNVARDTRPLRTLSRDRYITDQEVDAIYEQAPARIRVLMKLAYLTAQRIGDLLTIRLIDLREEGIYFRQQKTRHQMIVAWSPALREVVAEAKALHPTVRGMTLLHDREGKQLKYDAQKKAWDVACRKAGVEDVHFHDLRAKSATDARAQGLDSQKLTGHASESVHLRYLRSKEIPVATPTSIRQSN